MQLVDVEWQGVRGVVGQLSALLGHCGFGMWLGCEGIAGGC